jgi:hypothetical protein
MRHGRSTPAPTKAQLHRFDLIKQIGCLACWIKLKTRVPSEVHHLTVGGRHGQKRRGHDFTIGLCQWHHRGVVPYIGAEEALELSLGPSYAKHPTRFRHVFGTDEELLEFQADAIAIAEIEAA